MTIVGLYPRDEPRPTSSAAEKRLWKALKTGLPDGWVAWHSMKVRAPLGQDGESDFVLAIPDRGPLVVEEVNAIRGDDHVHAEATERHGTARHVHHARSPARPRVLL